jgi:hypothetical protein
VQSPWKVKKSRPSTFDVSPRCLHSALLKQNEQHPAPGLRQPPRPFDRDHRLARARAPGYDHPPIAAVAIQDRRLLVGQLDERLILLSEGGGQRHLDAHARRQKLLEHRDPLGPGRLALVARALVVTQHSLDRGAHIAKVIPVQDQLWRRVGREHQLVHADVGKRERVDKEQLAVLPLRLLRDLARERVAMVERLGERIAHPFPLSIARQPEPLPVPALQPAALDFEADDRPVGMAEHEVALVIARAFRMVPEDQARGMEHGPLV